MGLASYRRDWDLFTHAYAWTAGDAKVKLTREMAVVEKNMPAGIITEYDNDVVYIDPILVRTRIPAELFDVMNSCGMPHSQHSTQKMLSSKE